MRFMPCAYETILEQYSAWFSSTIRCEGVVAMCKRVSESEVAGL